MDDSLNQKAENGDEKRVISDDFKNFTNQFESDCDQDHELFDVE